MTLTELRDSIRRVLGVDLPLGEPTRLTRFTFHARQIERYRDGRILLAGDAAHCSRPLAGARTQLHTQAQVALRAATTRPPKHSGSSSRNCSPTSGHCAASEPSWPAPTSATRPQPRRLDRHLRTRPHPDHPDLRGTARDGQDRIDIHTAETDHRPADALPIRPDAHIAWAATIDGPTDAAALAPREALSGGSAHP